MFDMEIVNEPARRRLPGVAALRIGSERSDCIGPAVIWLAEGEATVRGNDDVCAGIRSGDVVTLREGRHAVMEGSAASLIASIPGAWARRAFDLAEGLPHDDVPALFVHRAGSDAARRAARILRDLSRHPADSTLETSARYLELLGLVMTPQVGFIEPRSRENRRVRARREELLAVLARLENAPLEGVSLATIAETLGTSERQTSRLFRSELATTFREYMSRLRLKRAGELLRTTDLPVIEVAAETGWRSLGHFTSTFGKRFGMTPSTYRARMIGEDGRNGAGKAA